MTEEKREWATLQVGKLNHGGYALILNGSQRGLFQSGDKYYNHQLKQYGEGEILNVVIRLSPTGRRMIQSIKVK